MRTSLVTRSVTRRGDRGPLASQRQDATSVVREG
jgi:hypothetical protein